MGAEKHTSTGSLARPPLSMAVPPQVVNSVRQPEGGAAPYQGEASWRVSGPKASSDDGSGDLGVPMASACSGQDQRPCIPSPCFGTSRPRLATPRPAPPLPAGQGCTPSHQERQLAGSSRCQRQQPHDGLAVASQPGWPMALHLWLETDTTTRACAGPWLPDATRLFNGKRARHRFKLRLATSARRYVAVRGLCGAVMAPGPAPRTRKRYAKPGRHGAAGNGRRQTPRRLEELGRWKRCRRFKERGTCYPIPNMVRRRRGLGAESPPQPGGTIKAKKRSAGPLPPPPRSPQAAGARWEGGGWRKTATARAPGCRFPAAH